MQPVSMLLANQWYFALQPPIEIQAAAEQCTVRLSGVHGGWVGPSGPLANNFDAVASSSPARPPLPVLDNMDRLSILPRKKDSLLLQSVSSSGRGRCGWNCTRVQNQLNWLVLVQFTRRLHKTNSRRHASKPTATALAKLEPLSFVLGVRIIIHGRVFPAQTDTYARRDGIFVRTS